MVSDTTPQLGGNLDTNGNDIEVGASDRITLGGIASGSYPEFQIKSTGSINQLVVYDGQIDFVQDDGGFKLSKLSQPSGAGGTSIELDSNTVLVDINESTQHKLLYLLNYNMVVLQNLT